ncbi:MAG: hypothetical protein AAGB05_01095 [Pseudomonadota bacterium]
MSNGVLSAICLSGALALAGAGMATAQDVSFSVGNGEVGNGAAPNEVVISTQQGLSLERAIASNAFGFETADRDGSFRTDILHSNGSGSFNISGQTGIDNATFSSIFASPGAVTASEQLGERNSANAIISNSPQSVAAQFQFGSDLSSDIAIVGGRANAVGTTQFGNNLGVSIGLIDSVETTVVYGQLGEGYSGSIVFRNAPAGTVITLR